MMEKLTQFDIYGIKLDPIQGAEQSGTRPCLLLQTNAVGSVARTVLIAPLSSKQIDKIYPYQILIKKTAKNGLKADSKIKLDQIRVIDRTRLTKKIGSLEPNYSPAIFEAIDVIFDRWGDFR